MTRKLKRPIALLLSVAMLVTMMFTGAFALTASAATITPSAPTGNGTADSPYQIGTAAELYWFAGLVNGDSSVCVYNADTNPSGIQKNASACAILTNSITLNEGLLGADGEPSIESPEAWTPISQFKGEFDGQDYTVSGLYINKPSDSSIGMFTSVSFGKVSNLNIADSYFFGDESVGGIAGYSKYSTIDNCSFSGTIKGINFIGGIVGNVDNDSVIKNCTFSGIVDGERRVGGIAGRSSSDQGSKSFTIIRHCTVNGKVLGEEYIGGICGQLIVFDGVGSIAGGVGARVSYCENNADVKSFVVISSISLDYLGGKVGGIVGHAYKSTVETSSNNGSVIANYECCGGVVGYLQNAVISDCYNGGYVKYEKRIADEINPLCDSFGGIVGALWGTVKNCYADGKVSGSSGDNGGSLFGEPNSEITVSNCYALKGIRQTPDGTVLSDQFDTDGNAYSEGGCEFVDDSVVGTGELAYKLGSAWGQEFNYLNVIGEKPVVGGARVFNTNYKNNSIENDYHNHNASGYSASCLICYGASVDNDKHKPTTDENGVYQISTAEELCWFAYNSKTSTASADAVLTNDIAINSNVLNEDGTLAVDASNLIMWDPMGCYATNGSIPSSQSYTGNFDGQGYTVSGLFFEDTNTDGRCCVGFFSRIGAGGSVKNLNITDSYFVANSSYGYVGGICGLNEGAIDNCTFSGVVTGQKYVGGICSTKSDSTADITISNCTNYGKISGESAVGGICGVAGKRVTITNCSNKIGDNAKIGSTDSGEITAGYGTVGGICGNSCGKIIECYNEGTVKGPNRVGGIVGSFSMTAKVEKCVNTRAKYPMELDSNYSPKYSGPISGDRFVGGICGSTDSIFGGVIKSCYNLNQQVCGTVANETSIGGLVGCCYSKAVIEGCFNYCTDFTKDNAVMTANTPKNYYLFGKVENNCTLNNNYYYIESLTEDCDNQASGTAFATKAQFVSGEVAYFTKLGQNIDSDSDYPKLDYPTIDGPQ
ncbi:MAG: GLUG motif-containing protein, partial [Acutalibacteraceae bacterium]